MPQSIDVIVIDGGVCSGKTTAMSFLRQKLQDLGFYVFVAHEAATELITAGVTPDLIGNYAFQEEILKAVIAIEGRYKRIARTLPKEARVVILCDRGAMDGAAYMPPDEFDDLIHGMNFSRVQLRDKRYQGVIFLETIAKDKPELYTLANNAARSESLEEAVALNERTLEAWAGCSHIDIIDNRTDMEGKIDRTFKAICRKLGIPEPLEIERKFSVKPFDLSLLPEHTQPIDIVQNYLVPSRKGVTERVRSRGQYGNTLYFHAFKEDVRPGVRIEHEHEVSESRYHQLLRRADPELATITKKRHCFIHNRQHFELDVFPNDPRFMLLELEVAEIEEEVDLPPYIIGHALDVTADKAFSNFALARQFAEQAA